MDATEESNGSVERFKLKTEDGDCVARRKYGYTVGSDTGFTWLREDAEKAKEVCERLLKIKLKMVAA